MRKLISLILVFLLAASALAENVAFTGSVEYTGTITVCAGTGGTLESIRVSPGQRINEGDLIANLSVKRVFMPWDGEIRALTVSAGERVTSDNAVSYEYRERYLLKASMDYAYSDATEPVRPGETLYLACSTDASHVGRGIAINVSGSDFDVLTTAGEFFLGEVVYVYRGDEANVRKKAGAATVYKADYRFIAADGYVTRVFVDEGERVTKGEALFDIAEGADTDRILSTAGGIVSTVLVNEGVRLSEDTPVLKLCDDASARLVLYGTETEFIGIEAGCRAYATFTCDRTETAYEAVVENVTYAPDESGSYRAELILISAPSFLRDGLGANIIIEID